MGAASNLFSPAFASMPSGISSGRKKHCVLVKPFPGASYICPVLYCKRSVSYRYLYFCNINSLSVSSNHKSTVQSESVISLCTQDESSHQTRRKQTKRGNKTKTIPPRDKAKFSSYEDTLSDVEIEVLRFMENSSDPYKFPTRGDLLRAGRADLVDAILSKGGWLSAGWDAEPDPGENVAHANKPEYPNVTHVDKLSNQNKAHGCSGQTNGMTCCNVNEQNPPTKTTTNHSSKTDRQRSWERVADLFGINASQKKPGHYGEKNLVNGPTNSLDGSVKVSPKKSNLSPHRQVLSDCTSNKVQVENIGAAAKKSDGNQSSKSVPRVKQQEKKRRVVRKEEDATINQSLERINKNFDKRNEWLMKVKSTSPKKPGRFHKRADDHVPITSRIQGLETELMSTLHLLQTGRRALQHDSKSGQDFDLACRQIQEASDALEFRETEVLQKRGELRKARAELTVSEGKLALQLIELQKNIDEKEKRLEEAKRVMKMFRTVRIVWPNPAVEVLLAGSFDGWSSKRKMQKSSAGVFITSLQLYPGRYEIKFIVNGEWKIDPNRPVTRDSSGFENNVLIIT